ncbi:LOW QUALITY PROTEIN: hypothetical protein JCM24511_00775 [Saitozyma sp. JCM 24511]|nr:LOW QUALITY PROTEIN: hypothetical protein JCM24511_00775 [Saitozyma sp. JCM 24511]
MDALLQTDSIWPNLGQVVHDFGLRTFLYAVDPTNLAKWTYLHPLVEDIPPNFVRSEKWAGCLGLPREIFLATITGVVGALASSLDSIRSVELEKDI